jgi:hypothetical protein
VDTRVFTWPVQLRLPPLPMPQAPSGLTAMKVLKRPVLPPLAALDMYIVDQPELLLRKTPAWLSSAVPRTPIAQAGVGLGSESPMYMVIRNTTISGGELGVRTFQNGTAAPVTGYDHVSLDHVTIQGASSAGVFMRNGNVDISNSNITGSVGAGVVGVQADTYATVNLQNSMVTSNTNGICIYVNSSAIIDNTTVADNGTNVEGCGGTVTGAGGAGPSPKLPPGGISAPSL